MQSDGKLVMVGLYGGACPISTVLFPFKMMTIEGSYVGTLDDGTVFDTTQNHGGPQPFSPSMPGLFPGFVEAMKHMQEGGQYRFTMPQKLAFPNGQRPQGFPPNSNLTFEVQVQKIVRGGAQLMQQMPQRR